MSDPARAYRVSVPLVEIRVSSAGVAISVSSPSPVL